MRGGGMGMNYYIDGCGRGLVGGRLEEVDGDEKLTTTETWMVFTGCANAMCNKV